MHCSARSPLVTVAIPFYNVQHCLADAIRSVFAQTYRHWELLLIDDGSGDSSLEIAAAVNDERVRLFSDGRHAGLVARLNQAAALARGVYLARMDADDLMHPRRLSDQVAFLLAHPQVDLLGTTMYSVDENLRIVGKRGVDALETNPLRRIRHGTFIHVSVTGATEWFRKHPYDESFIRAEDQELWCRAAAASCFAQLDLPLMFVREVGSLTLKKYAASARTMRRIYALYGPAAVGRLATILLVIESYLKVAVYMLLCCCGGQRLLVVRRNLPLNQQELAPALEALRRSLTTPVPGLKIEERR